MGKNRKQASLTNVVQYDSNFNLSIGSSASSSFNSSGSIIAASGFTGSLSGSVFGLGDTISFSSSISSDLVNLESKSASVDISITNINSFTASNGNQSLNQLTGSLATTGSNTFYGTQVFSGSVYIANDLVVQGSSSIQYITGSSVNIGTNIVQLNTANPSVRYAGLTVIDSGSVGGSGSFLYDSVQDEFIFVHRGNGTNVTSSHFVLGPETYDSLGNETYLTNNRLPKGTGKEHLVDSTIFDDGTTVCVNATLKASGQVCSLMGNFSCVGIGTITPNASLHINGTPGQSNPSIRLTDSSVSGNGGDVFISADKSGVGYNNLTTIAFSHTFKGGGSATNYLTIDSNGVSCFANTVCVPRLQVFNTNSIIVVEGTATNGEGTVTIAGKNSSGTSRSAIFKYDNADVIRLGTSSNIGMQFETNDVARFRLTCTGIACFACQVCSPTIVASTSIVSSAYYVNSYNSLSSTPSGQMGVLGHNAISCQQVSNTIVQMNNGYFGSFIRQYYNEGITFYTRANSGTAGDVLYGVGSVADGGERMRITSTGITLFACQVCVKSLTTTSGGVTQIQNGVRTQTFFAYKLINEATTAPFFRITTAGASSTHTQLIASNAGVGWHTSQIYHASNVGYWGGYIGSGASISITNASAGYISGIYSDNAGAQNYCVTVASNGTSTQSLVVAYITVVLADGYGVTFTQL